MARNDDGPVRYPEGIKPALAALRKHLGSRPLFMLSTRRYVPMRHRALAELLSGDHRGLPTGCYIEVMGQAHSGKTTIAFALADAVINQDPATPHRVIADDGVREIRAPRKVLYLDFEHVLDRAYLQGAVRNAVLLESDDRGRMLNAPEANVWVHQPDTMEEGGEVMLHLMASGEFGLVVVDSIPAMCPQAERERGMESSGVGEQARGLGKLFRRATSIMARRGVTMLLINQWRQKIGVSFGDPRATPGGKAAEFYDAIKLDVSGPHRTSWFAEGKTATVKTLKNKIKGVKGETCEYPIGRGVGLSAEAELTGCAMAANLVEWDGNLRHGVRLLPKGRSQRARFPGMAEWLAKLRAHPTLFDQLRARCEKAGHVAGLAAGHNGWEA